jgi:hypothetical protein
MFEAILLALADGAARAALGVVSTAECAHVKGWAIVIPPEAGPGAWVCSPTSSGRPQFFVSASMSLTFRTSRASRGVAVKPKCW